MVQRSYYISAPKKKEVYQDKFLAPPPMSVDPGAKKKSLTRTLIMSCTPVLYGCKSLLSRQS